MVPAADRNADRHVHRLHGAGKHRRRRHRAAPLDDHLRVRPGSRFRFLICVAADDAVRGLALLASLLSFNVGVELGQLLVLALMIPALEILFRRVVAERMGTIILSAIVAHTAWHWMIDRYQVLSQYQIRMPALEAAPLGKSAALADAHRDRGRIGLARVRPPVAAHGALKKILPCGSLDFQCTERCG